MKRFLAEWLHCAAYWHEQAHLALSDAADWLDR